MSSAKYSSALARLSHRTVASGGRPDAVTRQLGEKLRSEYLNIMREQAQRYPDQPEWFRAQLGGREATRALAELPPDDSAEAVPDAAESGRAAKKLMFTMQGRSFFYAASSDAAVFIGRESHCDAATQPDDDCSVSRVSAILYPQPSRGRLLVCDPGNLSGIRVMSRDHGHLGLPQSVPFSRAVLPLVWGERAEVDVCGVRVCLFPDDASEAPAFVAEEATQAAAAGPSGTSVARKDAGPGRAEEVPAAAAAAAAATNVAATQHTVSAAILAAAPPRSRPVAATAVVAQSDTAAATAAAAGSMADAVGSQADARATCRICLDQPRACCFMPCHHQICCVACARKFLRSSRPLCPICRSAIQTVVPIDMRESGHSYAVPRSFGKRKRSPSPDKDSFSW